MDGVEATRRLTTQSPRTNVVMLTSYHDDEHVFPAIRAGALSYVLKEIGPDELCDAAGISAKQLPDVLEGDRVGGRVTAAAARAFGLREGVPMLVGIVDGSAGMLLAGARVGQLFNVCGST